MEKKERESIEEQATVAAAMITASIVKAAQELDHHQMWKTVLCILSNAKEDGDEQYAVLVHALCDMLLELMDNTLRARNHRAAVGGKMNDYAMRAFKGAMVVLEEVRAMDEAKEPKEEMAKKVIEIPGLTGEMDAFSSASEILMEDCKSHLRDSVHAVKQGHALRNAVQVIQVGEGGCDCEECQKDCEEELAN